MIDFFLGAVAGLAEGTFKTLMLFGQYAALTAFAALVISVPIWIIGIIATFFAVVFERRR